MKMKVRFTNFSVTCAAWRSLLHVTFPLLYSQHPPKKTQKKLALRKRMRLSAITNTVRVARVSQLGGFAVACLWLNFSRSIVRSWSWRTQKIWRRGIKWHRDTHFSSDAIHMWSCGEDSSSSAANSWAVAQSASPKLSATTTRRPTSALRGADDWDYGTWSHVSYAHCFANDPPHLLVPHRRGPLLWCPQDTQHEGCILLQWNQSTSMFQIVKIVNERLKVILQTCFNPFWIKDSSKIHLLMCKCLSKEAFLGLQDSSRSGGTLDVTS